MRRKQAARLPCAHLDSPVGTKSSNWLTLRFVPPNSARVSLWYALVMLGTPRNLLGNASTMEPRRETRRNELPRGCAAFIRLSDSRHLVFLPARESVRGLTPDRRSRAPHSSIKASTFAPLLVPTLDGWQTKFFLFDFRRSPFMLFRHVSMQLQNTGVYSC